MTDSTLQKIAPIDHDWKSAGAAWGHAANDWSCLYEHYAFDATIAIFQRVGVTEGTDLLDVACGSGLAIRHATAMGAETAGIDAAESLINIAATRNPRSDVRLGSMFDLPWDDETFDVVTSINGIWGGCEAALDEAYRVLRPGGMLGFSFWGGGAPNDLRECFKAFGRTAPKAHFGEMKKLNNIAFPGVAESMIEASGFEMVARGARVSTLEWPDADIAWRALSSVGPAVPSLTLTDHEVVKCEVLDSIQHCRDDRGIYRFENDHHFVVARKPN